MEAIDLHLGEDGFATLLIPYHRTEYLKTITAEKGLFIKEILLVKQTPKHPYFRSILLLSRKQAVAKKEELIIYGEHRTYTTAFTELLRGYYLKL